jgi:hypothetical protein
LMSKIALIVACGMVGSIFSFEVQAFPGSPARFPVGATEITPVRGFCGLGFHRGPYGYCVRNGVPYGYVAPVVVAPPVMVAPRVVCPYGYTFYPAYGRCM